MLRETFDCILVGGSEFSLSLSLSLSDQQSCLRWCVLVCLRAACLLIIWLVFLSCLLSFPSGSAGKESACNGGDLDLIPGLERSTGEWNGYPLQYSGLENSMECVVHRVAKSQTWLSDFNLLVVWVRFPIVSVACSCVMPDLGSRCRLSWEFSQFKTPWGLRFYDSLVS